MAPCRGFCDGGTTDGTCTGAPELCDADPDNFNCNHCCECPGGGGGSTERRTDGSGSCKRDNSSPDEFLTTDEELELDCDCDDDGECDEGYSCENKNKCSGTRDVKAEYEFEE